MVPGAEVLEHLGKEAGKLVTSGPCAGSSVFFMLFYIVAPLQPAGRVGQVRNSVPFGWLLGPTERGCMNVGVFMYMD